MRRMWFIVVCLSLATVLFANTRDSVPPREEVSLLCAPESTNFGVGEKITYVLYYNWGIIWLSAGEVTFEVKEEDGLIHLRTVGKTYSSYEWFYSVDNVYESYLDPETLLPVRTTKNLNEGNYYLYEKVNYDRLNGKAITQRKRSPDARLSTSISEITPCVHDLLSLVYAMRAKVYSNEYHQAEDMPIELFLDEKQYDLSLDFQGVITDKEIKKQGAFDVMHFTPALIEGQLFEKGDVMDVFVSYDKNVVPLQIESPLSVGKVKAILKEHEGLQFPLSSKSN